jgi:hypothetical protein
LIHSASVGSGLVCRRLTTKGTKAHEGNPRELRPS